MTHTRLAVTPSAPARRDAVSAALFAAGAEGLLEDGARFVAVFALRADAIAAEAAARDVDDAVVTECESYDPGDWADAWRRGVTAHRVGKVVIVPPWLADAHTTDTTIIIDPGMGFGTGEHETTRLALLLLQDALRAGDSVADVGCGSAVLAIGAAKLGAGQVAAIENDQLAIANATENVERNGVAEHVTVIEGDAKILLPLLAPVRVIVANIIAPVLLEMLPSVGLALAPGGDFIVGGVLRAERDAFVAAVSHAGYRLVREEADGDWWSARWRRAHE